MGMTRTASPLEVRRRDQQVKERWFRGVALDRFAEHVSLHQWEPMGLDTLRQVAPKTVTNRANAWAHRDAEQAPSKKGHVLAAMYQIHALLGTDNYGGLECPLAARVRLNRRS